MQKKVPKSRKIDAFIIDSKPAIPWNRIGIIGAVALLFFSILLLSLILPRLQSGPRISREVEVSAEKQTAAEAKQTFYYQPSEEIMSADPLSGQVQLGDCIFTLPCPLKAFMESGFLIEKIDADESDSFIKESEIFMLAKNTSHKILLRFDENTVYEVHTFDTEETVLPEATVILAAQYSTADYYMDTAVPMFLPRGIHIGSSFDEAQQAFAGDAKMQINPAIGYYLYNGPIRLSHNSNNNLRYYYSRNDEKVISVALHKNQ